MADEDALRGRSAIVAGAGLAGLAAAFDLRARGAKVTVLEARDRTGGRVWTLRDGFADGQHAEAGGDLIDEDHEAIRRLATDLALELVPVLLRGFAFVRGGSETRPRFYRDPARGPLARLRERLAPWLRAYRLAERRWDGAVSERLARVSVAEWLDHVEADADLRAVVAGLRSFFLADPSDLSLLALVDVLASETAGDGFARIKGGNDRLVERLAAGLGEQLRLRTEVLAVSQTPEGVRVMTRDAGGGVSQVAAHFLILALPATALRRIAFTPPLAESQRDAIGRLRYGRATKTLLQFGRRFWRGRGRPRAYGTDLPIGAVWEANEEQRGPAGILTLLAGGSASDATRKLLAEHGMDGLVSALGWLGPDGTPLLASRSLSWEEDPWVEGGYAYFDPGYAPALQPWLARPHGRILFAGEHTSLRWQGYMNGAVESGLRAAAEVRALSWQPGRGVPR